MRPNLITRVLVVGATLGAVAMGGTADAADDDETCDGLGALGGVNSAPLATDDEAWVEPGGSVIIEVLENDLDFDGDSLTIAAVTATAHGEAKIEGGTVIYEPGLGFEGDDTFTYRIDDGSCGSDQAQVRVEISEDPPPPDEASPDDPITQMPTFTG
ncbi:MAG: hypothetical protein GY708_29825 [Actinomycetia bacterium]|nr:hypothetical protein [Actinomycetes bacterium]MCP4962212.1 hypothetical protein [Actinomycetes bacterium]